MPIKKIHQQNTTKKNLDPIKETQWQNKALTTSSTLDAERRSLIEKVAHKYPSLKSKEASHGISSPNSDQATTQNPSKEPSLNTPLLFHFAEKGDLTSIETLLQSDHDLSSKNDEGKDAVLIAYENKHFKCASTLLYAIIARSSNPKQLYAYYASHKLLPLFYAVELKDQDLLNLCIEIFSPQLHTYRDSIHGNTILMTMIEKKMSIENKHLFNTKMLNAQRDDGQSALMLAIQSQDPLIYNKILKHSPNVSIQDSMNTNALHFAILLLNDIDFIENLLKKGVDPTTESKPFGNALDVSIDQFNLALVEKFARWPNMRIVTPLSLKRLCHRAVKEEDKYFQIFSYLWQHTNLSSLDYSPSSPFTHPLISLACTIEPSSSNSRRLIARMNLMSMVLNTPHLALNNTKLLQTYLQYLGLNEIRSLLQTGFPLKTQQDNQPPYLIEALHYPFYNFQEILEHAQAMDVKIVDHTNEKNETALMVSSYIEKDNFEPMIYIKALLEHHANLHIQRSTDKNTATMLALKANHLDVFNLLFQHATIDTSSMDWMHLKNAEQENLCMIALKQGHTKEFNSLFQYALSNHPESLDWLTHKNFEQEDLFMIAFSKRNYEVARIILEQLLKLPAKQKSELFKFYEEHKLSPLFLAITLEDQNLFDTCLPFCSISTHVRDSQKNNLLMSLIKSHMKISEHFLSLEMIFAENETGKTALYFAIQEKEYDLLATFKTLGVNFCEIKNYGNALTVAAQEKNLTLIKEYSNIPGMSFHAPNSNGLTPIDALLEGNPDRTSLKYLLNCPNFDYNFSPTHGQAHPFLSFVKAGDTDLLTIYLKKAQINFSETDADGHNAWDICAKQHNPSMLQMLCNLEGMKLNQQSFFSFINKALSNKNYASIEWILHNKSSGIRSDFLECVDPQDGQTLLIKVLRTHENFPTSLIQAILSFDFDSSVQTPDSKENALMLSLQRSIIYHNHYPIFAMLLEHLIQKDRKLLNLSNQGGKTILMIATEFKYNRYIDLLLSSGADPNIPDQYHTPLQKMLKKRTNDATSRIFLKHFQKDPQAYPLGIPPDFTKNNEPKGALYFAEESHSRLLGEFIKIASTEWILRDFMQDKFITTEPLSIADPDIIDAILMRFKLTQQPIPEKMQKVIWCALLDQSQRPQSITNLKNFLKICPLKPYNAETQETPILEMKWPIFKYIEYIQIIAEETSHINSELACYLLLIVANGLDGEINSLKLLPKIQDCIQSTKLLLPEKDPFHSLKESGTLLELTHQKRFFNLHKAIKSIQPDASNNPSLAEPTVASKP